MEGRAQPSFDQIKTQPSRRKLTRTSCSLNVITLICSSPTLALAFSSFHCVCLLAVKFQRFLCTCFAQGINTNRLCLGTCMVPVYWPETCCRFSILNHSSLTTLCCLVHAQPIGRQFQDPSPMYPALSTWPTIPSDDCRLIGDPAPVVPYPLPILPRRLALVAHHRRLLDVSIHADDVPARTHTSHIAALRQRHGSRRRDQAVRAMMAPRWAVSLVYHASLYEEILESPRMWSCDARLSW